MSYQPNFTKTASLNKINQAPYNLPPMSHNQSVPKLNQNSQAQFTSISQNAHNPNPNTSLSYNYPNNKTQNQTDIRDITDKLVSEKLEKWKKNRELRSTGQNFAPQNPSKHGNSKNTQVINNGNGPPIIIQGSKKSKKQKKRRTRSTQPEDDEENQLNRNQNNDMMNQNPFMMNMMMNIMSQNQNPFFAESSSSSEDDEELYQQQQQQQQQQAYWFNMFPPQLWQNNQMHQPPINEKKKKKKPKKKKRSSDAGDIALPPLRQANIYSPGNLFLENYEPAKPIGRPDGKFGPESEFMFIAPPMEEPKVEVDKQLYLKDLSKNLKKFRQYAWFYVFCFTYDKYIKRLHKTKKEFMQEYFKNDRSAIFEQAFQMMQIRIQNILDEIIENPNTQMDFLEWNISESEQEKRIDSCVKYTLKIQKQLADMAKLKKESLFENPIVLSFIANAFMERCVCPDEYFTTFTYDRLDFSLTGALKQFS